MVEAESQLKLLSVSTLYIYKVHEHIDMLSIGIAVASNSYTHTGGFAQSAATSY